MLDALTDSFVVVILWRYFLFMSFFMVHNCMWLHFTATQNLCKVGLSANASRKLFVIYLKHDGIVPYMVETSLKLPKNIGCHTYNSWCYFTHCSESPIRIIVSTHIRYTIKEEIIHRFSRHFPSFRLFSNILKQKK